MRESQGTSQGSPALLKGVDLALTYFTSNNDRGADIAARQRRAKERHRVNTPKYDFSLTRIF